MSGAHDRAVRLVEAAVVSLDGGDLPNQIDLLSAHGVNRPVDREIRHLTATSPSWGELTVDAALEAGRGNAGMLVALGSHRNGYVREAIVSEAGNHTGLPGVVTMLAHRTSDPVPVTRDLAIAALAGLLTTELQEEPGGEMPAIITRAAQGIVSSADSLVHCPELVIDSLTLFEQRTGKYRRDRGRDHHIRTLREIDRRSQLLDHLRSTADTHETVVAKEASNQLIEFYEHSLALTPRGLGGNSRRPEAG